MSRMFLLLPSLLLASALVAILAVFNLKRTVGKLAELIDSPATSPPAQVDVDNSTQHQGGVFPPGPRGLPFLGNLLQLPLVRPWLFFSSFKDNTSPYDLGDHREGISLLGLRVLGKPILVINELSVARDLLDRRSGVYSDRPGLGLLWDL